MPFEKTETGAVVITGDSINTYQAMVIARACEMYAKHGIRVNRAYTPTAMLKAASNITGCTYKRGQHQLAADDIRETIRMGCAPHQIKAAQG